MVKMNLEEALKHISNEEAKKFLQLEIERLQRDTITDSLTGILNRRGFEQRLDRAIKRANRYDISFTYGFVDLYGLKQYNEISYQKGDEAIKSLATILQNTVRGEDAVARTGGDEFSLIITELREEEHEGYKSRMNKIINSQPRIIENLPFEAYWGLTEFKGQSIGSMIYEADRKLNEEKERKKLS